jgi:adenosylmethionine-8-amino-7-oxononanoate aminotransferase
MAVSASGLTFTLEDGRTVLDAVSGGAAVASLGQGNKEIIKVMADQAEKLTYAYHQSLGTEPAEQLSRLLCEKGGFGAAAFLNSGPLRSHSRASD